MANELNLSKCTAKFTTEKHYEYPERMQYLNATLRHPVLGELATARCLQIHGRIQFKNAGDFLEIMDEDSQEMHEFSVGLFDKYSNVRPWLVDGGAKSGSGCWGMELSIGDMLYIEEVKVKGEFRRRGVGSWLLHEILNPSHMGYKGHAFCWPTPIDSTDDKAEWMEERAAITAFFRKNDFRRIGRTSFLAYSPDPSHPSRRLAIACDPETALIDFESTNVNAPDLSVDELQARYPVHYEITTNKTPSVTQVICAAHQVDARSVHQRDLNGLMPVHVAAASENVHALRALLGLDPRGMAEDLKDAKNKDGMTPLEGLESSMRSTREFMETLLGVWNGYSDEGLSCEFLLKKAMSLPVTASEPEYIKKSRFGCTCMMCTDGWLSPRMRFRLLAQAEIQHDMLRMDCASYKPYHPLSASEVLCSAFDYIPPPLRLQIYKTFYIGFYTIFDAISHVLKTSGIPTPQAVLATALELNARAVHFYLAKGGRVEYVLDATVDIAREQSSLGDGTFEETFDYDEEDSEEEGKGGGRLGYRALGACRNDLEFGVVRWGVGVGAGAGVEWGPYYEAQEMDVDDHELD